MQSFLQRHGILVTRYPLQDCLQFVRPTTVLDVGANIGQYGLQLRSLGFRGAIHSFEPFPPSFEVLRRQAARSRPPSAWRAHHFGLGEREGQADMHVSRESVFNSLRDSLPQSAGLHAGIVASSVVPVPIRTLDSVWDELQLSREQVFLKLDTQGYELPILQGGPRALQSIRAIQLEVSLSPLYKDQPCIEEIVPFLRQRGFLMYGLWPTGFRVRNENRLLEADLLCVKS